MLYTLLGIRKLLKQRGALLLRVLRATDPHAREILERAEALSPADLTRLHGAIRELRVLADDRAPDCVIINGAQVRRGSAVRLHPHGRADAFDMLLAGKLATVESIDQDFEQRVQLAVSIDEDPGCDLGMDRMPGHRFFFAPAEVEPMA